MFLIVLVNYFFLNKIYKGVLIKLFTFIVYYIKLVILKCHGILYKFINTFLKPFYLILSNLNASFNNFF